MTMAIGHMYESFHSFIFEPLLLTLTLSVERARKIIINAYFFEGEKKVLFHLHKLTKRFHIKYKKVAKSGKKMKANLVMNFILNLLC